jgi:Na+-driven multidrug efflux pump
MTQQVANQSDELRKGLRVAKNTVVLFLRMFVLMLVNLYAVRVLIRSLGVSDYGVFQAVAGVVTTLTCLNSVLSASTQRFYNYAIGKGAIQDVGRIFSISVNINVVFSIVILLLFETVGIWFLNTQMMIPETRMLAANHLFQFSIFSFLCTILQIPFMAALMAHEDMGW